MRRWRVLIAVTALVLALVGGAAYFVRNTTAATGDAYAAWWVADMVIEYMETHDGAWPRSWDDLREPFETCTQRSGRPWTFEQLRDRVEVDWDADPNELATKPVEGSGPPFKVIWLRNGGSTHWKEHEPNRMVLDYLRSRKADRK